MSMLETYTGVMFNLVDPSPADVRIEDIARSLSRIPRFNGHTREAYSVAQHSVFVESIVAQRGIGPLGRLAALLHDAAEAYVGDVTRPVRELIPKFQRIHDRVMYVIEVALLQGMSAERMGVAHHIREADNAALATEARDQMSSSGKGWLSLVGVLPRDGTVIPWSEETSRRLFMQRYNYLRQLDEQRRAEFLL